MWPFVDPVECLTAMQYLAHRQPLEAARVLLPVKDIGHKAVLNLLLRIAPQLVEQARQAFEAGDLLVAGELLDCATQCAVLPADAKTLRDQIAREQDALRQQQDWNEQQLVQADRWAKVGRLYSALGMIEPLADDPQVARRKLDWKQHLQRLERYAVEFHGHLAQAEFLAAEAVLRKARELAPGQPLVLCLEQEWREARAETDALSPSDKSADAQTEPQYADKVNIAARTSSSAPNTTLLLSGLSTAGDVLLLAQPVVTIGTPRDSHVDLPIQALLRRRHALLIREQPAGPNGQTHRLVPLAGAAVSVNGRAIPPADSVWLVHGDVLQFGPDVCRWKYRRPVARSATAVLEQSRPGGAAAVTPDGRSISRVVLMANELMIGHEPRQNHLVEPNLAVRRLRLETDDNGWHASVEQGVLFVDNDRETNDNRQTLRWPAELMLYADGPGLVGNALQGDGGAFQQRLNIDRV
ncbi:MAG: FHA domain-containing protein [Planctomycetia bacterium]|nr:FHA domain-containing protein [Planctomycetia bacterium]